MSKTRQAGFTAIPNEVKAWAKSDARAWVWFAVEWLYDHARNDTCAERQEALRKHLRDNPQARTRQGTVPSRWAIWRLVEELRERGFASVDREANRRGMEHLVRLVRWVKNRMVLRSSKVECNTAVQHGPTEGKSPLEALRVQHGSATPIKDDSFGRKESPQARINRLRRLGYPV